MALRRSISASSSGTRIAKIVEIGFGRDNSDGNALNEYESRVVSVLWTAIVSTLKWFVRKQLNVPIVYVGFVAAKGGL